MSSIKEKIKKIVFGYKYSSASYEAFLRKGGVQVGEHLEIFCPHETNIEAINPHLLEIGSYVSMTGPVNILTHDYSVCVTKKLTGGEILGNQKPVKIGNNVFLGWGCCVLPGTTIGDNCIVGAYAVVSGKLEPNSVYAGNPARKIETIEEYYNKRKEKQLSEAVTIYQKYKERFHKEPSKEIFHEYFYLFEGGDFDTLDECYKVKFPDHGNFEETVDFFKRHKPLFSSFDEFKQYAEKAIACQ